MRMACGTHAGASALDAVLIGIQELKEGYECCTQTIQALKNSYEATYQDLKAGQKSIQRVLAERFSQTRQASTITEEELEQVTKSLNCIVVWAYGDPFLEDLLGHPEPDEDMPAWW